MGIRACIWPTGTPNPPAIAWSPQGLCLQHGPCALRRARDTRRGLGSSRTLHHLRLPPRPAATGQIICLSQRNIPVVVRVRVGAGWAGMSIPIVVGSRTEDLFIFEQGRGVEGRGGKTQSLPCMFCCSYNHRGRHRSASFSWRARPGPPDTTEPLSACPGALRLRKKEWGQIFGFKDGFRRSQQSVCGLDAGPVHWGRRDGVPRSSGVVRDIVTWLPPNTSPSPRLTASEASKDPSPLALHNEHFGAQPQLLNNINNNNNLETFSCNIRSRDRKSVV